jgi:hypothetical protein
VQSTLFMRVAATAFLIVANVAAAEAQIVAPPPPPPILNPSAPLVLPAPSETPVSPIDPGTLPGTTAASGLVIGTNPITGLPCTGEGSSSAVDGTNTLPGATAPIYDNQVVAAPAGSVYGLGNESDLGAC